MFTRSTRLLAGAAALGLLSAGAAHAVPAFAVQTGQACQACHVGGFGPQLTPFGRDFKLRGYTARVNSWNVPLSAMAVASYLHTAQDQPPAKNFAPNDNFAVDQVSLFVAGGIGSHFGGFVQTTYDGVGHSFSWDNLDLRAVTTAKLDGRELVLGLSLNNNPTVQDPWNTLAAWGYPYTTANLAPSPAFGPMLNGGLAQVSLGITAYALYDGKWYVEAGGYQSPGSRTLTRLGADPTSPGSISGVAPYVRLAYQANDGDRNWQIGAFMMDANINPGLDTSTGRTDGYLDLGVDGSFQKYFNGGSALTFNARYTHERQNLTASNLLGMSDNLTNHLNDLRFDTSYYYHGKYGLTVGMFETWGSTDYTLFGGRVGKPDSGGVTVQFDVTPWGDGKSPLGRRFNLRMGVQYTAYWAFNGAGWNYDGYGSNAGGNNALRIFTWLAY
jgi:hypothetical protein